MAGRKLIQTEGHEKLWKVSKTEKVVVRCPTSIQKRNIGAKPRKSLTKLKSKVQQNPGTTSKVLHVLRPGHEAPDLDTIAEMGSDFEGQDEQNSAGTRSKRPSHDNLTTSGGVAVKVDVRYIPQQPANDQCSEWDDIIHQKYADSYERLNPGTDKCYDEQRRINLYHNLYAQGYSVNNATSIAAWLMRCNGRWQPWQTGKQTCRRPKTKLGARDQTSRTKGSQGEASPTTVAQRNDANPDSSSIYDGNELEGIKEFHDSQDDIQTNSNPIEAAIARARRSLGVFHKVYGKGEPKSRGTYCISYYPTHISKLPRALPEPGLCVQNFQPIRYGQVHAAQLNLPRRETHKDDDKIDVLTEDLLFGDSVQADELLSWVDRVKEREERCKARLAQHNTEPKTRSVEEGATPETLVREHRQRLQDDERGRQKPSSDWESVEIEICQTFGSSKPYEPWKALAK